uniref:Uncharacterized protein n=1 Tax=Grammatophora oceanica TaxID=210454 RepID=A0A7S1UTJ0_9STRA|mmetsp:Transcript_22212/g.33028  ORF Transcript_22212/g.33028 Transcript_22212/m.33028 type:complete len:634 (+) Transcript_22212:91-1992(+)|eukprot:CAMPEP_0194049596 /NCGR_PEP_ID=MMETSP0009_2-20130614/30778_1 /TAXON_ID=210454 /ORGANISM="Grammatophora oceanica, Strain CCMP 410" /LENGTH=633 /DNA_ID=CAMNT_0038695797 /DNA_START=91 /DNA_END=1992 /DNA_ORIENTATION=+
MARMQDIGVAHHEDNDVGLSLPSVEEAQFLKETRRSRVGRNKWTLTALGCLCLLPILIGCIVGLRSGETEAQKLSGQSNVKDVHRLAKIVEYLMNQGVSSKALLEQDGALQNTGAKWLADFDTLQLDVPASNGRINDGFEFVQRYVLILFYMSLGGDQWLNTLGFMTSTPTCEWGQRVGTNYGEQYLLGVTCDAAGRVTEIFLPGNQLIGSLPTEFGHLSALTKFSVYQNEISGELPETMTRMTDLNFLVIEENSFEGPLPTWIGELRRLRYLAAGHNKFTGTLPEELAFARELVEVALDGNKLKGKIGVFDTMPSLRRLYLGENMFSGDITNDFLKDVDLVELDLSNNAFGGTLPLKFFNDNRLQVLDLHDNAIGGMLPRNMERNDALGFLALHGNFLGSSIPTSMQNLQQLSHLDLSYNELIGTMPHWFDQMPRMEYLFLGDNGFEKGHIPSTLKHMVQLKELSLKRTHRNGHISSHLGEELTELILLDLDGNKLTGTIPSTLGKLTELKFLLLNRNELHGTIPSTFKHLKALNLLMLDNNTNITGTAYSVCHHEPEDLAYFVTDCAKHGTMDSCDCCTECCDYKMSGCNAEPLVANLNPVQGNSYRRDEYVFSDDIVFHMSSGTKKGGSM